jgi:hypothetical protein
MSLDNPSARIRETKEVLERLEKRLERYYQPPPDQTPIAKHSEMVQEFQSKLHDKRELCANTSK